LNVRSPAPPLVELVGLLGEQVIPVGKQLLEQIPFIPARIRRR
jgi:XapX domain-containing protein